jgi:hypothetical protein
MAIMVRSFLEDYYERDAGDIPLEVGVKIACKYGLKDANCNKEARVGVQEVGNSFYTNDLFGQTLSDFLMYKLDASSYEYSYVKDKGEDSCSGDGSSDGEEESESGSEEEQEDDEGDERESKKRKTGDA